jgi:biotin operon repressor
MAVQANARCTTTQVMKEIGLSRSAIRKTLIHLESEGSIERVGLVPARWRSLPTPTELSSKQTAGKLTLVLPLAAVDDAQLMRAIRKYADVGR